MKLNLQSEKYSKNMNQSDILQCPKKICHIFVNKVYDSCNKVSYLQKNKKMI